MQKSIGNLPLITPELSCHVSIRQLRLDMTLGYIYYYNNIRKHSSLNYQTPYQHLQEHLLEVDKNIRFVIPIMLDKISVEIGNWSEYNVLAQHPIYIFP